MADASARAALGSLTEWMQPVATQLMRPAVVGLAMLVVGAALPPAWVLHGPQLCIFKLMSGLPCPGCGLTRSVVLLMHGDVAGSLYYHPLGLLFVAGAILLAVVDAYGWWQARRDGEAPRSPGWLLERLSQTPAPWVLIAGMLALYLVRLPLYLLGTWVY
jgi:hypothetical protein